MSDGNFNRALLPKNELSAGIRAGKAQMRAKAQRALAEMLDNCFPNITEQQRREATELFLQKLRG